MSNANPTLLSIGMTGTLEGRRYTIRGRMVLSMEIEGETWKWNEFYLVADDKSEATLVFEVLEEGVAWRFFEYFQPSAPFTLEQAARVRLGQSIQLDGMSGKVDLVDQSRVEHIDGEAPEGVAVGDVSCYFNATVDGNMLVVSWAEGEVEHFWGRNLRREDVKRAFGAADKPQPQLSAPLSSLSSGEHPAKGMGCSFLSVRTVFMVLFVGFVLYQFVPSFSLDLFSSRESKPPAALCTQGQSITVRNERYSVVRESFVEQANENATRRARQYELVASNGSRVLLRHGVDGSSEKARLLSPLECPLTQPSWLALQRRNGSFSFAGQMLRVVALQRVRSFVPDPLRKDELLLVGETHGLLATDGTGRTVELDWTEKGVRYWSVQILAVSEVKVSP